MRRRRRGGLSEEAILAAAIRVADAEGLEAVSIRRLAAELDARPMSLYDYFQNKEEIFAAMGQAVTADALVAEPLPADWREALALIARSVYAVMAAHPWLVFVFTRRSSRFGQDSVRLSEQYARALAGLGLEQDETWTLIGILNDYLLGYSLRMAADPNATLASSLAKTEVGDRPDFAALQRSLRSRSSPERFERGLQLVLDGIEAELETRGKK